MAMSKTLSMDLRERIVAACDRGEGTRMGIAARYKVSLGMVKKLLQQRRRSGDIAAGRRSFGAKTKRTRVYRKRLMELVTQYPDMPWRSYVLPLVSPAPPGHPLPPATAGPAINKDVVRLTSELQGAENTEVRRA